MSSFSSNAILAKARSMYSHRLTEQNYEELLKRRSINDLVAYLKSETAYSDILADLKEVNVHRGQLEALLNKEIFLRLDRLMRFASKKELEFYRLGVMELEIQLILTKARLIVSDYYTGYEIEIPDYLNKYASFDLYGLLAINDYDSLLFLLKGTKYYDALLKYKPEEDERFDSNLLELELKHIYYAEYVDVVPLGKLVAVAEGAAGGDDGVVQRPAGERYLCVHESTSPFLNTGPSLQTRFAPLFV